MKCKPSENLSLNCTHVNNSHKCGSNRGSATEIATVYVEKTEVAELRPIIFIKLPSFGHLPIPPHMPDLHYHMTANNQGWCGLVQVSSTILSMGQHTTQRNVLSTHFCLHELIDARDSLVSLWTQSQFRCLGLPATNTCGITRTILLLLQSEESPQYICT